VNTIDTSKVARLYMGVSLLALSLAACGNADEPSADAQPSSDEAPSEAALARFRRYPHQGATGGAATGGASSASAGSGGTASEPGTSLTYDCSLCRQANECCTAVSSESSLCSFKASTCLAYPPDQQKSYATYCLTFIRTVISAWQPQTPPAVCLLTG
jgi:hypothetical protein